MALALQQLINGLTLGAVYGLIAIGYTMVYGIIGMINFAHGDIFMVGTFIALIAFLILVAIGVTAIPLALFLVLLIAMLLTSLYGWAVERIAYRPLRGSFRLAPLITAIGTTRAMGQLDEFRTRRIVVPVPNLPTDLDGMTIVQVSDVHVGHFTRGKTLGRIVDAVNNLRPDLIMHTGDLINHALSDLPAALDMTRRLEGRFGQFLCEGNHDLIESRAGFEQSVTAAGLPLLLNTTVEARVRGVPVQVLGLRWGWPATIQRFSERRSPDEAIVASMGSLIAQRNADAFGILLAHHPHAFDIAANAGIPLTLSGHTHGGQLHLSPGLGFGPVMYRYWSGLYQRGDASLVVSNGVGNWFPLRINAPAEIVHITLRRS